MQRAALKVNNLSKHFGPVKAVDKISFNVKAGEIFGFLGPNGAGKTTTIRCLLNFLQPTSGKISVFGSAIEHLDPEIKNNIGYLSADAQLYDYWNAREHIDYMAKVRGRKHNADELIERLHLDTNIEVRKLSTGNKQKLSLVLAFMHQPKLLILDEPTRGLDPLLQQEIYKMLDDFRANNGTVFMSSHNLAEVERVCDHVGIIRSGKMVASETMQTVRKLQLHRVRIVFSEPYRKKDFELDNVEIKSKTKRELVLSVEGDINPLLKVIAGYKPRDLTLTHASLEDTFLRYYNE